MFFRYADAHAADADALPRSAMLLCCALAAIAYDAYLLMRRYATPHVRCRVVLLFRCRR